MTRPDMLAVIGREGVRLRKSGKNYVGLCPFHSEKTPSFSVNPDKQLFHCFGCGEGGDVYKFISKLYNTNFRGAMRYLGLERDQMYRPDPNQVRGVRLVRQFREWCEAFHCQLCSEYRLIEKALHALPLDHKAPLYKMKTLIEYRLSILEGRDDAEIFALWKEATSGY
jgi:hypothetical protein